MSQKTTSKSIRLPDSVWEGLRQLAVDTNVPLNRLIRNHIEFVLAERAKKICSEDQERIA